MGSRLFSGNLSAMFDIICVKIRTNCWRIPANNNCQCLNGYYLGALLFYNPRLTVFSVHIFLFSVFFSLSAISLMHMYSDCADWELLELFNWQVMLLITLTLCCYKIWVFDFLQFFYVSVVFVVSVVNSLIIDRYHWFLMRTNLIDLIAVVNS